MKNTIPRMIGFVPHLEYFGFSDTDSFYPDVTILTSFQDYSSGIDPVFECIRTVK